jgi:hypothetical protein
MPTGPVAHRPLALGHVQSPVAQGWINDPGDYHWSPHEIVGFKAPCGTITPADATVMAKIWDGLVTVQGKKLWFGLERGASLAGLAPRLPPARRTFGFPCRSPPTAPGVAAPGRCSGRERRHAAGSASLGVPLQIVDDQLGLHASLPFTLTWHSEQNM